MELVLFTGNLLAAPEMRYTPSGTAVCNFPVAVDDSYMDNATGQRVKRTKRFRVTTWGKLAENCNKYLDVGRKVLVQGSMNVEWSQDAKGQTWGNGPKTWQDSNGDWHASLEITASSVEFLSSQQNGGATGGGGRQAPPAGQQAPQQQGNVYPTDDGLPF